MLESVCGRRRTIQLCLGSDQSISSKASILAKWSMLEVASRAGRLRAIDAMAKSMSSISVPHCCGAAFHCPHTNTEDAGSLRSAQHRTARKRRNSLLRRRRCQWASTRERPKQISAATGVQRQTADGSSPRSRRNAIGRRCRKAETALVSRSSIRTEGAPDSCGHFRWRPESHLRPSGAAASLSCSSDRSRTGPRASPSALPRPVDRTPRSAGSGSFLAPPRSEPVRRARIAENTRSIWACQILIQHSVSDAAENRSQVPCLGRGLGPHCQGRTERSLHDARLVTLSHFRDRWRGSVELIWCAEASSIP